MPDILLTCSKCGNEMPLTDSLAAPLLEQVKKEYDQRLANKNEEILRQQKTMDERTAILEKAEAAIDETIAQRVATNLAKTSAEERKKARTEFQDELDKEKAAREETENLLKARNAALKAANDKEAQFLKEKRELEEEKAGLALQVEQTVSEQVAHVRAAMAKQHEVALAGKLREKDSELKATNDALEKSRLAEAEFIRKQRDLDVEKRKLEVTVQEKVNQELIVSRSTLRVEIEREASLKLHEKGAQLEGMKKEIENLKRKSEQGSQQGQGEAQEREIIDTLSEKFPNDVIRRVPKGEFGGDCLHQVYNSQGKLCGTILWESKRTRNWSDNWLAKLKGDQHAAKADVAIILSQALPKDVELFEQRGEIWVAGLDCLVPVAGSLRHLLIEVASTKRASEGHQDKAALIYSYVTSVGFRQRIRAMTEAFTSMQDDLRAEQKAIKKQWAKREMQLEKIADATAGMYGDLQGIAGKSVPELDGLGFDALEAGS